MSFERLWPAVTKSFSSNGTIRGTFQVADYTGLYVKQLISLTSTSQQSIQVQIKRIEANGTVYVGGVTEDITHRLDISSFLVTDSASLFAPEQIKTKIKKEDQDQASYESEPINARRVIGVDAKGNAWSPTNPLPTTATISGDVTIGTDGYDLTNPDSMNITGSEDGTKTGIKHSARVDSELDLRVGISDGANKANVSIDGKLSVDDENTQTLLAGLLAQLQSGSLSIGTEDGTETGTQHVFVNNLKSMILASHDRIRDVTYLDPTSKKNRRVEKFEFTSATFPGITLTREFNYTLIGSEYVYINDNWTLI